MPQEHESQFLADEDVSNFLVLGLPVDQAEQVFVSVILSLDLGSVVSINRGVLLLLHLILSILLLHCWTKLHNFVIALFNFPVILYIT